MPRLLLFLTFAIFLGAASPSHAAVYPNGKFFLFSGLAHTAFERLNVQFPGWVQPDFRPLTENRAGFLMFLKEVRQFFITPKTDQRGKAPNQNTNGNNVSTSADFSLNTILRLQLDPGATLSDTIDIFIGVNLKRILTQIFSTVFDLQDEFVIDTRESQRYPLIGGTARSSSSTGNSFRSEFSTFNQNIDGALGNTRPYRFLEAEQTQFVLPPAPFSEKQDHPFRIWRKRISEILINPVALFGFLLVVTISFARRVLRTQP